MRSGILLFRRTQLAHGAFNDVPGTEYFGARVEPEATERQNVVAPFKRRCDYVHKAARAL